MVASASYDGELVVWKVGIQQAVMRLHPSRYIVPHPHSHPHPLTSLACVNCEGLCIWEGRERDGGGERGELSCKDVF